MNNLNLFILLLAFICTSCGTKQNQISPKEGSSTLPLSSIGKEPLTRIALGSCNRQDQPQDMWAHIIENDPQLWIWLGDNIYGDSEDMEVMKKKYDLQMSHPEYQALLRQCPIIGIWDDHDYGVNDGDKSYPMKAASKELMLDFLDVPEGAEVRKRPGAYQSFEFGPKDQLVKIMLLDARSFRDELTKETVNNQRQYAANQNGDVLGEAQWTWLEKELSGSKAKVHIIGCGIQFIPEEHRFEKWANFPAARQRLFDLLVANKVERPILLSGDRHIGEISKIDLPGLKQAVYEMTSSGLTHSYEKAKESNRYRQGPLVVNKNFGVINIDWTSTAPEVELTIKGIGNKVYSQLILE